MTIDRRGPLSDERVLDLSTGVAGAFCAKLLGDLGADVIKIERPGLGDPLRSARLVARGVDPASIAPGDLECDPQFLYLNTSKRSVALDLEDPAERERLLALVADHDIVVADATEPQLAAVGLGREALRSVNPSVILTTVSGFGSEGPKAGWSWSHLTACAEAGWADGCGAPGREPLQAGGALAETVAGGYAAVGTLAAVEARARDGHGDHVDVSAQEAGITCSMYLSMVWQMAGVLTERHSSYMTGPSPIVRGTDGWFGANSLTEQQWQSLCLFLGIPEYVDDERFPDYASRAVHVDEIAARFAEVLGDRSVVEAFHEAQSWRVPVGYVMAADEALRLDVHAHRGYLVEHEHPVVGRVRTPRVPFVMPATPSSPGRPPLLGEHTDEVLGALRARDRVAPRPAVAAQRADRPPLDGLRVVDLTAFMSGPLATMTMADLGADVIKVESVQRLDGWRGNGRGGTRPWEHSPNWNWINRSKRGITLNLTDPRGAAILRSLVAEADVVVENYTPRVMDNFGLGWSVLSEGRSDLIMLSMPGFGLDSPWRDYCAFAYTTEEMGLISSLTGYEGEDPLFTTISGGDPLAGVMASLALLSALNHRRRTGEGQWIDLSQLETASSFVGEALLEAQLSGRAPGRRGNRSDTMAPHGCYPTVDGRWVALGCADDEAWQALCDVLGIDDAVRARCAATPARHGVAAELDLLLGAHTERIEAAVLVDELQRRGVTAGLVANGRDHLEDPHLRARGFFVPQDRGEMGVLDYWWQPYRFATNVFSPPRPAPNVGQHNTEVLRSMGITDEQLAELDRDLVTGDWPLGIDRPEGA